MATHMYLPTDLLIFGMFFQYGETYYLSYTFDIFPILKQWRAIVFEKSSRWRSVDCWTEIQLYKHSCFICHIDIITR